MRLDCVMVAMMASALMLACGSKKRDDQGAGQGEKTGTSAAEPAVPEQTMADVTAQCEAILDKSWTAVQPAMAKLGIDDPARHERRYKQARMFLQRCRALTAAERGCLAAADHPPAAIWTCNLNRGKRPKERIHAPDLHGFSRRLTPTPLTPDETRQILASLAGTWVNRWTARGTETTWTIGTSSDGKTATGTYQIEQRDGSTEQGELSVSLLRRGRLMVKTGARAVPRPFFQPDDSTFLAAINTAYEAFPAPDLDDFIVRQGLDHIVFKSGACDVVSRSGVITTGTCSLDRSGDRPAFRVQYQFPGDILVNDKPRVVDATYDVIAGHLIHRGMIDCCQFSRGNHTGAGR